MTSEDRDLAFERVPIGTRPALIVVDMAVGFTSVNSPLGGDFDEQVNAANALVTAFADHTLPIVFTRVVYEGDEQSVFRRHLPDLNILTPTSQWVDIDPRLVQSVTSWVLDKTGPSAFFDTALNRQLRDKNVDSVMVCGLTTSGCVRATVVDALQYNFPTWVISDACGDRNHSAHSANLHDMHAKYAEVVDMQQALAHLDSLTLLGKE